LSDLARKNSLPKAASFAMLQTLFGRAFIANGGDGIEERYRQGMTPACLDEHAVGNIDMVDSAVPVLCHLSANVRLTSEVAVLHDRYAVAIRHMDAPAAVRFDSALGRREQPRCSAVRLGNKMYQDCYFQQILW
jgi:IclR family transcriptional regulator, acetate operon repressor